MCLRSWKRMSGSPAFESRGLKERVISSWRRKGVPTQVLNARSSSSHIPPGFVRSSSCASWCFLKEPLATSGSLIDRLPLAVFGGLKKNPFPTCVDNVRRTWSVPASRLISYHCRPSSSPCLIPVVVASTYRASNLSPLAVFSRVCACLGERGLISFFSGWGAFTASATFRGTRLSTTACFKALCEVTLAFRHSRLLGHFFLDVCHRSASHYAATPSTRTR